MDIKKLTDHLILKNKDSTAKTFQDRLSFRNLENKIQSEKSLVGTTKKYGNEDSILTKNNKNNKSKQPE